MGLLGARRGDDGHPRRSVAHEGVRHVTTRHEQGRRVHGRRPRPAHRSCGGGDGDARPRGDEPRDRHRRRVPRPGADGRDHRAGGGDKLHKEAHQLVDIVRMFEPVTEVEHARRAVRGDPRDRPQGRSGSRPEKPGPTHIELPEDIAATASGRPMAAVGCRSRRADVLPRADRRGDRPRRAPDRIL